MVAHRYEYTGRGASLDGEQLVKYGTIAKEMFAGERDTGILQSMSIGSKSSPMLA